MVKLLFFVVKASIGSQLSKHCMHSIFSWQELEEDLWGCASDGECRMVKHILTSGKCTGNWLPKHYICILAGAG